MSWAPETKGQKVPHNKIGSFLVYFVVLIGFLSESSTDLIVQFTQSSISVFVLKRLLVPEHIKDKKSARLMEHNAYTSIVHLFWLFCEASIGNHKWMFSWIFFLQFWGHISSSYHDISFNSVPRAYQEKGIKLAQTNYIIMSGILCAVRRSKAIIKAGICAKAWYNTSYRFTQTHAEIKCNHPWTRDQLAERMKILKARRLDKYNLRSRFATFRQSSSVEISVPVGLEQVQLSSFLSYVKLAVIIRKCSD